MTHNRPTGAKHPRWNNGRMISSHGYVLVRLGVGHPLANSRGVAYEHHVVWAASGRAMPHAHETIHHRNGQKDDNRLSNLQIISRAEHARLHAQTRRRTPGGTFARERAA